MNNLSRTLTGGIMILIGIFLIVVSFFLDYFFLIYGIVLFVIGLIIYFNKKEDEIEKIKKQK
jgi:membrane-bound ClpP family serine protease